MIEHHGKSARDPFLPGGPPFVATPGHAEARARLLHAIEAGERLACLRAPAGLGKTTVLDRALAEARGPGRRIAKAVGPPDGTSLLIALAGGLGVRVAAGASRGAAWRALADAVR